MKYPFALSLFASIPSKKPCILEYVLPKNSMKRSCNARGRPPVSDKRRWIHDSAIQFLSSTPCSVANCRIISTQSSKGNSGQSKNFQEYKLALFWSVTDRNSVPEKHVCMKVFL